MAASLCRSSKFVRPIRLTQLIHSRNSQTFLVQDENYDDAHYPAIKPKFPHGKWGKMERVHAWIWDADRERIASLTTAKDKIDYLTETEYRVWRYKAVDLSPDLLNYQLKLAKTYLIDDSWPLVYDSVGFEEYGLLKKVVTESIIQELELNRERLRQKVTQKDEHKPGSFIGSYEFELSQIHSMNWFSNLLGILGSQRKDILESHLDCDAIVSACWYRDGVLRKMPFKKPKIKNYLRQNNSEFYGTHTVPFQLRKSKPLPEFVSTDNNICHNLRYSDMLDYNPVGLGLVRYHVQREINPGYKIGTRCPFTHLSFISMDNVRLKKIERKFGEKYKMLANKGYLMSTGFLSTMAQAHIQGFNKLEELTYPFTTQTILTDGQNFMLSAYQLNTLHLWKDDVANTLQNVCWVTDNEQLYEKYENGELVGFNDNLLKKILKMFCIAPSDRNGIDLAPNLKEVYPSLDIPDETTYTVVEENFKYDKST